MWNFYQHFLKLWKSWTTAIWKLLCWRYSKWEWILMSMILDSLTLRIKAVMFSKNCQWCMFNKLLSSTEFLHSKAIPQLCCNSATCWVVSANEVYIKLKSDTSIFTCHIPLWLQPKLGSATHITLWVKETFCVYSNKATCFAFLKPSSGHHNVNQGNYANIHSFIFFSSHEISYLTLKFTCHNNTHTHKTYASECCSLLKSHTLFFEFLLTSLTAMFKVVLVSFNLIYFYIFSFKTVSHHCWNKI